VVTVLNRWPSDRRWPLLDLARLIAAHCGQGISAYSRAKFVSALCTAAEWKGPWENPTPQRNTIVGLVLRAAANALIGASASEAAEVLAVVDAAPYGALNKASRGAYAAMLVKCVSAHPLIFTVGSILRSFSIVGLTSPIEASSRSKHLYLINNILQQEPLRQPEDAADRVPDPEVTYRALVSLGNVVQAVKTYGQPITPMEAQQARVGLSEAGGMSDPRIATVISDTRLLMQ
jgi:hypothetical protein